jgi:hypothetical protein
MSEKASALRRAQDGVRAGSSTSSGRTPCAPRRNTWAATWGRPYDAGAGSRRARGPDTLIPTTSSGTSPMKGGTLPSPVPIRCGSPGHPPPMSGGGVGTPTQDPSPSTDSGLRRSRVTRALPHQQRVSSRGATLVQGQGTPQPPARTSACGRRAFSSGWRRDADAWVARV